MADVSLLVSIAGSGRADAPELVGRILSRGTAVNRDHAGSTALISAARVGSTAVVRELLRHGADASKATRDKGNPPLFWAAAGGHLEVVDLLLGAGASPSQLNANGDSALMWACRSGAGASAAALLRAAPALIGAQNATGMTALMCAAAGGHAEVVAALLSPERAPPADTETPDAHGRTALHFAAQSEGVTRALLAAGASWRARDVHGQTAEGEAKKRGCAAVEALLHEAWVKEVEESKEEEVVVKEAKPVKKGGATPPVSPLGARAPRPAHRKAVVAKASRRVAEVAEVVAVDEGGDEGGREGEGEAGGAAAEGGVRRECTPMASARLSWLSDGDSPPDAGGGWVEVTQRGRARGRAAAAPREVADAVASPTAAASTATDTAPTRGKVEKGGSEEEAIVCAEPPGGGEGGGVGGGDAAADEVVDSEAAAPEAVAAEASAAEASAAMASAAGAEAWAALLVEAPEMGALDLQLAHVLGQRLGELSMAQITAVQAVQRDVALRLEDARVELARRLERETVEARLQIEIEKAAREARWRPPAA